MAKYDLTPVTTTFFHDFTIAEAWGEDAIRDTYKRSFDSWRDDIRYITELVIALNRKVWWWWDERNRSEDGKKKINARKMMTIYNDLWRKAVDRVYEMYEKGDYDKEEIKFYNAYTD